MRSGASVVLGLAMVVLGIAMIVRTIVAGGSVTAYGIVLGVLFVVVGAGRAWLARERA